MAIGREIDFIVGDLPIIRMHTIKGLDKISRIKPVIRVMDEDFDQHNRLKLLSSLLRPPLKSTHEP